MNQDAKKRKKGRRIFLPRPNYYLFLSSLTFDFSFSVSPLPTSYPQHLVSKKRWNYTNTLGFQLPFDHTNLCINFLSTLFLVLSLCFLLALHYAPISSSLQLIFSLFFLNFPLLGSRSAYQALSCSTVLESKSDNFRHLGFPSSLFSK